MKIGFSYIVLALLAFLSINTSALAGDENRLSLGNDFSFGLRAGVTTGIKLDFSGGSLALHNFDSIRPLHEPIWPTDPSAAGPEDAPGSRSYNYGYINGDEEMTWDWSFDCQGHGADTVIDYENGLITFVGTFETGRTVDRSINSIGGGGSDSDSSLSLGFDLDWTPWELAREDNFVLDAGIKFGFTWTPTEGRTSYVGMTAEDHALADFLVIEDTFQILGDVPQGDVYFGEPGGVKIWNIPIKRHQGTYSDGYDANYFSFADQELEADIFTFDLGLLVRGETIVGQRTPLSFFVGGGPTLSLVNMTLRHNETLYMEEYGNITRQWDFHDTEHSMDVALGAYATAGIAVQEPLLEGFLNLSYRYDYMGAASISNGFSEAKIRGNRHSVYFGWSKPF